MNFLIILHWAFEYLENAKSFFLSRDQNINTAVRINCDNNNADLIINRLLGHQDSLHEMIANLKSSSIDENVNRFTEFIQNHAFVGFGEWKWTCSNTSKLKRTVKNTRKWFNVECYEARELFD